MPTDNTMTDIQYLDVPGRSLAYHHTLGKNPGLLFCGGFSSDMEGTKALALEQWGRLKGIEVTRFDYQGHGASSGHFTEGTIGNWYNDSLCILDQVTSGSQIIVGSSMGGWIMILLALARPHRIAGLIGIAAAPDFTEELIWKNLDQTSRQRLIDDGILYDSSADGQESSPITRELIEEARSHLVLGTTIDVRCPVRLIHGICDQDVPWQTSMTLLERLNSSDVHLVLIKDGTHRCSRPQDIDLLKATCDSLISAD